MKNPKYEIIHDDSIEIGDNNRKVYRVKALKNFTTFALDEDGKVYAKHIEAGDLGGYIEKEENLSQFDKAWVDVDAVVFSAAVVYGDAYVGPYSMIGGRARIYGSAKTYDAAIGGTVQAFGHAKIFRHPKISGKIILRDHAVVRASDLTSEDDVYIYRNAMVYHYYGKVEENIYDHRLCIQRFKDA